MDRWIDKSVTGVAIYGRQSAALSPNRFIYQPFALSMF